MFSKAIVMKRDVVVAAVCIFVLLSAMGAVGKKGRFHARKMVCRANLGAISQAWWGFVEDNDGKSAQASNMGLWEDPDTGEELDAGDIYGYWGIWYADYIDRAKQIFHCPSANKMDSWCLPWEMFAGWPEDELKEIFNYCHYGLNTYTKNTVAASFPEPANLILTQDHIEQLLDGINSDMFCIGPSASINLSQWRQYEIAYPDIYGEAVQECFRHEGDSQTLWVDGHVTSIAETTGENIPCVWYDPFFQE